MSTPQADPDHLRELACRDPIAYHQRVRSWRNACLAATFSAIPGIVVRHLKQRLGASPPGRPSVVPLVPAGLQADSDRRTGR